MTGGFFYAVYIGRRWYTTRARQSDRTPTPMSQVRLSRLTLHSRACFELHIRLGSGGNAT